MSSQNPSTSKKAAPSKAVVEAALGIWSEKKQQHAVPVKGNSMLPLFQPDDHVFVAHGNQMIRRGDVIVFRRNDELTVHRVIDIKPGPTYLTKGDNLSYFDSPVPVSELLGRVVRIQRGQREININTRLWRLTGQLIVAYTMGWGAVYQRARRLKQRFLGPQPNRVMAFLRQTALGSFALARRMAQAIFGRFFS